MSDAWVVTLAGVSLAAALAAVGGHLGPVPLVLAVAVVGVALAARWPALLCVGVALLTATLAHRSLAGLTPPATGPVRAEVTLVSDPAPDGRGGVQADVRHAGRRLSARAHAAAAAALGDRLAGERITMLGTVRPPGPIERRQRHRHLAGRLEVETVVGWRPGHGVTQAANALRRTLAEGAEVLPERQRSLLAGLTLGDDRHQPADLTDAFQGAGLTHLLAVSGANVVFVMIVCAPLLVRLRFGPRLAATLGVLAGFALLTRFEPSVLRATAMAAVAATGTALGRPASALRALGLGVTGLVLVDPLLASSLGFQLSVAGTGGIVVGASALQRCLPGPRWWSAPLSVTLAAQASVAPLLVSTFGPVPLASIPANLLAVPAAGPVMVWGLTGGLVAGLAGGPVATVLHLPTRVLLAWIEAVAQATSRWPLGDLDAPALLTLALGAAALVAGRALRSPATEPDPPTATGAAVRGARPHVRAAPAVGAGGAGRARPGGVAPAAWARVGRAVGGGLRAVGACVAGGVLAGTVGAATAVPAGYAEAPVAIGATAWRAGGAAVVVLDGRAVDRYVLRGLREAGIRRVDVVAVRSRARTGAETVATLRRRWPGLRVLAPGRGADGEGADIAGAASPRSGTVLTVGGLRLTVVGNVDGRLEVEVAPLDPDGGSLGTIRAAWPLPWAVSHERERPRPNIGRGRKQHGPRGGRHRGGARHRDWPVGGRLRGRAHPSGGRRPRAGRAGRGPRARAPPGPQGRLSAARVAGVPAPFWRTEPQQSWLSPPERRERPRRAGRLGGRVGPAPPERSEWPERPGLVGTA